MRDDAPRERRAGRRNIRNQVNSLSRVAGIQPSRTLTVPRSLAANWWQSGLRNFSLRQSRDGDVAARGSVEKRECHRFSADLPRGGKVRARTMRYFEKTRLPKIPNLGTNIPRMGTNQIPSNLSGALFSRVQSRVLGIIFGQPDQEFQLTEIISKAGSGRGAVQRELEKLTDVGIVATAAYGNRKLYHANRKSPVFNELHQLVLKTVGIVDPLREALTPYRQSIKSAFVYGSIAKGKDTAKSDIDVMIVAEGLAYSDVFAALQQAEKHLARPVNPNLMTANDWGRKVKAKSAFVTKILSQPKLFVFGNEDELRSLG
jgi:predicted nucleotidyltransferase